MTTKYNRLETTGFNLLKCLQVEMPRILSHRPVMLAYLYGSVVDGSALPTSDLDIGLVLEPGCGLSAYERMQLEFNIAAEIERCCGVREADVRVIDVAPLTVQGMVVSEGVLLYSKDEAFHVQYEVYTRKRYFDFLPVVEMMRASFFEQIKKEGLTHGKTRKG
jgi:predicted nucleotidyltransferase